MIRPITLFLLIVCLTSCGGDPVSAPIKAVSIPTDGGSAMEREMASLIRGHPQQNRKEFIYLF